MNTTVIIDTKRADVTGDGTMDTINLTGAKENPADIFIRNIALVITDGATNRPTTITFPNNAGYDPRLFIGDFNKDGVPDILVSIDSGGSGGFGFYYVYSFRHGIATRLFDNDEFNRKYHYTVTFENNCRVRVYNEYLKKTYYIDVHDKRETVYADIYDENCRLLKPVSGFVPGLNNLYPLDTGQGSYNLLAVQRVIGLYGADTLGYLETVLTYNGAEFVEVSETLTIN